MRIVTSVVLSSVLLQGCALFGKAGPSAPAFVPGPSAPTDDRVSPAAQAAHDEAARDTRRHALRRAATELYGAPNPVVPTAAGVPTLPDEAGPAVLTSEQRNGSGEAD